MRYCIICGNELVKKPNKSKRVYEAQKFCSNQCIGKYKSGEMNNNWKGDDVGYDALHSWIKREKGETKKCEHCGRTDRKKYEWANVNNQYRRRVEDFIRLCTSCHRRYDFEHFYKPRFDIEEARRLRKEGKSFREIARTLGVGTHGTIQRYIEP